MDVPQIKRAPGGKQRRADPQNPVTAGRCSLRNSYRATDCRYDVDSGVEIELDEHDGGPTCAFGGAVRGELALGLNGGRSGRLSASEDAGAHRLRERDFGAEPPGRTVLVHMRLGLGELAFGVGGEAGFEQYDGAVEQRLAERDSARSHGVAEQ